MEASERWWPSSDEELVEFQNRLARHAETALNEAPWSLSVHPAIGGCFVAFARGEAGPGHPGDQAWAAAVVWQPTVPSDPSGRSMGDHLRGVGYDQVPRRADDVLAQSVAAQRVPASYARGLLARREGPILATAVAHLELRPEVMLVDATGTDHPRHAGLAVHLGMTVDIPTVGVTHRPLLASGSPPVLRRGATSPIKLDRRCVGYWVCTRTDTRAVVAHAGWRTTPETAAEAVLVSSTAAARTPVPLQEARRVAREARSLAEAG